MKKALMIFAILLVGFQLTAKEKVEIAAKKAVKLSYEEFANYDVRISNKSGKQVNVSVINPATNKKVSGFGLAPLGTVKLYVAKGNILKLKNTSTKDISLNISFVERKTKKAKPAKFVDESIQFTLHNSSLKSIPLIIPNVMNPNLSPMSNSGVSLKRGQKVFLKKGMSKVLLFTVDDQIENGDKIDVAKLIRRMKK